MGDFTRGTKMSFGSNPNVHKKATCYSLSIKLSSSGSKSWPFESVKFNVNGVNTVVKFGLQGFQGRWTNEGSSLIRIASVKGIWQGFQGRCNNKGSRCHAKFLACRI